MGQGLLRRGVMLPLNVSLDLGLGMTRDTTQRYDVYMDSLVVT